MQCNDASIKPFKIPNENKYIYCNLFHDWKHSLKHKKIFTKDQSLTDLMATMFVEQPMDLAG